VNILCGLGRCSFSRKDITNTVSKQIVTTIQYDLPITSDVQIIIYDILGHKVIRLVDVEKSPGFTRFNGMPPIPDLGKSPVVFIFTGC